MPEFNDLAAKKAALVAVEAEIATETQKFEDSIDGLRKHCELLRIEYMEALQTEVAAMERAPRADLGSVLAAIEQAEQPMFVRRIRRLAVSYLAGRVAS